MPAEKKAEAFTFFRSLLFPVLLMSAALFLFSACGQGLPDDVKKQANAVPEMITSAKSKVETLKQQYQQLTASARFSKIKPYAEKEAWINHFDQAVKMLDNADRVEKSNLRPLVKKNKPELLSQVNAQVKQIRSMIQDALKLAAFPAKRHAAILQTIENIDGLAAAAAADHQKITAAVQEVESTVLAKTLEDFPEAADKTRKRFAPLTGMAGQAERQLEAINQQMSLRQNGEDVDYALLTDESQALSANAFRVEKECDAFKDKVAQLYKSYTKILKDMKTEYTVTIKRESWDENSDFYDPAYTLFTRTVSEQTYETLTAGGIESIGEVKPGWRGSQFSTPFNDAWKELNINPGDQWPGRGHNAATFWVEDTREKYFHQYIMESDGETSETGWEKVDEAFYEAHFEHLGMAILAKPYGTYEEDRMTQAAPPGMAYVGNPQYGQWQTDNNGDRFWSWYGKYAFFSSLFFFPPTYYSYNSWNRWNRDYRYSRPYYGTGQNGRARYGTNGSYVRQSPKFQGSHFGKSGGFRSQSASVRGAGPGLRGGGPKSKGK